MRFKPHHTAISVRNLDDSLKFYETLGFKRVHTYKEDDGSFVIAHLKFGDTFLEIFAYKKNESAPKATLEYANNLEDIGVKHIALFTDNIEVALKDLQDKGLASSDAKVTYGESPVSYFFIQDPDGMWVEILKEDRYS